MRSLSAALLLLVGCSAGSPGPIDVGLIDISVPVEAEAVGSSLPPDVYPVFLRCEWGCPPGPFYIRLVDSTADTSGRDLETIEPDPDVLADAIDLEVSTDCEDAWSFSECCGDGTCQRHETAFFCPADC
tara:strand:- start:105 stop:491 length:387 start_codon:yes stop_codon:yes gene_type:complete